MHYKVRTGEVRPAIIVNILGSGRVNLQVFLDSSETLWCSSIPSSTDYLKEQLLKAMPCEEFAVGTWQWPPRES